MHSRSANCFPFMKYEDSFLCLQQLITGPILNQMNHTLTTYILKIYCNITVPKYSHTFQVVSSFNFIHLITLSIEFSDKMLHDSSSITYTTQYSDTYCVW